MTSQRVKDATDTAGERLNNGCMHDFRWHPDAGDICARCGIENDPIPAAPSDNKPERSIADEHNIPTPTGEEGR